jgi:hypothetical protein
MSDILITLKSNSTCDYEALSTLLRVDIVVHNYFSKSKKKTQNVFFFKLNTVVVY